MQKRILRVLVAKPGLDGHDRGAKVISYLLKEQGFDVIYSGLHQTVDQIVATAVQEDVDVIGLSIMTGAHLPITEKLMAKLREIEADDIAVTVGGVIANRDIAKLKELGAKAVFPGGTKLKEIIDFFNNEAALKNQAAVR